MKKIELRNIRKTYGDFALEASLSVESGEFLSLLGPSGSGKTTLLHIVAGFVSPDSGKVIKDGKDITNLPTEKRNIGVVFQDYALFPYMNVFSNIAFGLRIKRIDRRSVKSEVLKIAERFEIENVLYKYPDHISGGEKQRVALARAMIVKPDVLLMDEPLSSLDAKIREFLMHELRDFHKEYEITVLYVTHDQNEAMFLSDRIALMNGGSIEQIGNPLEIYENPKTDFARKFIGKANFVKIEEKKFFVRPEDIVISKDGKYVGKVVDIAYLAGFAEITIHSEFGAIEARDFFRNVRRLKAGDVVKFDIVHKSEI